jgi:hypothetical protein
MSRTYTDYLLGARRLLESGVPTSDVLGATDRIAVDLFFRPRQANDRFDCASWACEVSRSYDHNVAVRLATVCLLTFMMRVSEDQEDCRVRGRFVDTNTVVARAYARILGTDTGYDEAYPYSMYGSAHRCNRNHSIVSIPTLDIEKRVSRRG